jgi:hypothetical protein
MRGVEVGAAATVCVDGHGASRTASAAHHQRLLENVFRASSLVAPTTHDGVDLFYQLLSAHRSVPPRESAYLIPEVTDRFLSGERIGRPPVRTFRLVHGLAERDVRKLGTALMWGGVHNRNCDRGSKPFGG